MPNVSVEPEKTAAIRKIRRLMAFWNIDTHELRGVAVPVRAPAPTPGVRYRHPESGESWDGVGPQPQWLRTALTREGYTVAQLRVQPGVPQESSPGSPSAL